MAGYVNGNGETIDTCDLRARMKYLTVTTPKVRFALKADSHYDGRAAIAPVRTSIRPLP